MVCFTLVLHIITFDKCNGMWTYPSIYCLYHLSKTRSQGSLEPISEESGHKAGNTLDGVKIHRSAQSHIITYPFTHYGQFRAYQQCIYIILGPQIDTVLELLSVWGFTCSPKCAHGFPSGSLISSHLQKTCWLGDWWLLWTWMFVPWDGPILGRFSSGIVFLG